MQIFLFYQIYKKKSTILKLAKNLSSLNTFSLRDSLVLREYQRFSKSKNPKLIFRHNFSITILIKS